MTDKENERLESARTVVRRVLENHLATDEETELDRYLRSELCTRPASGPDAQSIDGAAHELVSVIIGGSLVCGDCSYLERPDRARAALALLDPHLSSLERMRRAAAFLRGGL